MITKILSIWTSKYTYAIINKYYPGEQLGNYHQKRVRVNFHYFVVMENGYLPYIPQTILTGNSCDVIIVMQNQQITDLVRLPSQWSKTRQNKNVLSMLESWLCWFFDDLKIGNDWKCHQFENNEETSRKYNGQYKNELKKKISNTTITEKFNINTTSFLLL